MKNPTPIQDLNTVLTELTNSIRSLLGEQLLAVYLQGSFALGDWDEHSDVDFMVVVKDDISDIQFTQLQAMHERIFDFCPPWSTHLEGSYFPQAILKTADLNHTPLVYIDNASRTLERSTHDNELVVRWVTREYGIPLYGADAKTYIDPIPTDDLKQEVRETMNTWADDILEGRYELNNQWAQPFAVLSYCRMLHTLQTGRIHSKLQGAEWAKSTLGTEWKDLIDRAWDNRPNPGEKVWQRADPKDLERTFQFIRYVLELSKP